MVNNTIKKDDNQNPPASPFDDIFTQLGLEKLTVEEKKKMLADIQEIVENRALLRIAESLSEEDRKTFTELKDEKEVETFFKKHDLDPVQITVDEAMRYREELLQDASYIQGQVDEKLGKKSKKDDKKGE